jgi:uncharacterized membrane protein YoaK (UPF0700 family)
MEAAPIVSRGPEDTHLSIGLFLLTFSTGLIDAVSFIALGHVFTANMTGNVVFIAFAVAGVPDLSVARSLVSLGSFMLGAVIGGRLNLHLSGGARRRWVNVAAATETFFLLLALAVALLGGNPHNQVGTKIAYAVIVFTGIAMGVRNAVVRKLAIPDLTTTVLTLTVTGLAAESTLGGGNNQRWFTRAAAILTMLIGAFTGALLLRFGLAVPLVVSALLPMFFVGLLWLTPRVEQHGKQAQ